METRKKTTAGVLFWTPAPAPSSPTSSVISEDTWEDEDEEEEQAERDDDFVLQMDENGIIGLSEALQEDEEEESGGSSGDPGEEDPSGNNRDSPELWSNTGPPGHDGQIIALFEDLLGSSKSQSVDETARRRKQEKKYLEMTEEEKDGEENTGRRNKSKHRSTWRELGPPNGLTESFIPKEQLKKISSTPSCSNQLLATEPGSFSNHHCLISPISPVQASSSLLHLLHFTAEELAASPGIDAETLPEISFTESHPVSLRSLRSGPGGPGGPGGPEVKPRTSLQPAAAFSGELMSDQFSNVPLKVSDKSDQPQKQSTPSPRKMRQPSSSSSRPPEAACSSSRSFGSASSDSFTFKHQTVSPDRELRTPGAQSNAAGTDESRKGPLSHRRPDFSKVEPRVHFPKGGYKPPKSRRRSVRTSLSPEPPFVFKSPADIVKEVLLNTSEGSPASSDSFRPPTNSTVPQEFRCRQQATTLLDQLQEDYNRLLTKYAEAENTIDRLRLEAKVNLYSDPPQPGLLVQSGPNRDASKILMLNFPQAQRAEITSASPHRSPSSPRSPDRQMDQQLEQILYSQTDKFLQQLQTFQDLLKSNRLNPFEQMKGLSQLAEGLDSLERGYLLAKDQNKQPEAGTKHFDPERDLEGLIFQCGLRMEELKEQVEDLQQEQPSCEAPPSPPPHPTPSSLLSEGGGSLTHPQSPVEPLEVDGDQAAAVEVSSASQETDEEEETLNSLYLKPLNGKHRRVQQDFNTLLEHYQSFKELPKHLNQREEAFLSGAVESNMQPGDQDKQKSLPQRRATSDHPDSPPVHPSKQQTSSRSRTSSQASTPHLHLPSSRRSSRRRLEGGRSHSSSLSSLGEITALERRNSKLQAGSSGALYQDGIISPETDSGFVCSESSRLTPAAAPSPLHHRAPSPSHHRAPSLPHQRAPSPPHQRAPSPLHQRAPSPLHQRAAESVSVRQEGRSGHPASSPASSPSHSQTVTESRRRSRLGHDQQRRSRPGGRRRTFSCSPQRCLPQTEPTRADDSGTSGFGLESDSSHTVSEDRLNDRYTQSVNSLHTSSSSPAARRHHGDPLRALSSSQVANCNDAIQTLQTEVSRLRERLENCLKNKKLLSSVRAPSAPPAPSAPSAQENYSRHNTSTPRIRSGERRGETFRGGRVRQTDDDEESTLRRTTTKRSSAAHRHTPQPDVLTEPSTSRPQPQTLVSRFTQTSAAAPDKNTVHSRTSNSRQPPVVMSTASDEADSRGRRAAVCPQCLSRLRERSEVPVGGDRETAHSSQSSQSSHHCLHCPLCGRHRDTETEASTHTSCRTPQSPERAARSVYFAAAPPPALLRCMPVCPTPLLLYSSPIHVSPNNGPSTSSEVRGRREARGRTRRSLSVDRDRCVDKDLCVDSSLNRAIRAARHMKHTSGHMARSLASGLNYQELLAQSCSY
ncbi:LOW QUALITY PROTEIN: microtubule organization protein AKNA [Centropristis striata]|uniref:LOW QUALITY PROTEIN: microtubule organization protein AKNA n=1 Tax=Centropristis striata TaxID=184440 RepID=UPI0027E1C4C8|nr:LOW QUALITY PROTEIN: microtubule organization protein AKNA [Centropristis striata]